VFVGHSRELREKRYGSSLMNTQAPISEEAEFARVQVSTIGRELSDDNNRMSIFRIAISHAVHTLLTLDCIGWINFQHLIAGIACISSRLDTSDHAKKSPCARGINESLLWRSED
jgi:hypothetical protein